MAIPIKQVPILSGDVASEFVRLADERERGPRHPLTAEQEAQVQNIVNQLREFKFPWQK